MIMIILKKIVWEIQKWYYHFNRLIDLWVIDENKQNSVSKLITQNLLGLLTFLMQFLSFSGNLIQDAYVKKLMINLR